MKFAELLRVVEEFDLEPWLLDHGFSPTGGKKSSEEWTGACPVCQSTKNLCVDTVKRGWHCWKCEAYEDYYDAREERWKRRPVQGAGGLLDLVCLLEGLEKREAIEFMAQHSVLGGSLEELPDLLTKDEAPEGEGLPVDPPPGWAPIHFPLPYMIRRGITMEDARWLGLFWVPSGRFGNRLVFPVWESGRLMYWQARAMYEADECPPGSFVKSLNPTKLPGQLGKSDVLMNLDVARTYPRVAIVEGPTDLVRAGPSAVCTFGKTISPAQIAKLSAAGVKAVDLMWDGPKPGSTSEPQGAWPEMLAVAPRLSMFFDVRLVFLPENDPGSYTRDQLDMFRHVAVPSGFNSGLATL